MFFIYVFVFIARWLIFYIKEYLWFAGRSRRRSATKTSVVTLRGDKRLRFYYLRP